MAQILSNKQAKNTTLVCFESRSIYFAIYDVFKPEGRNAHFAGKVAAALKDKSDELVEGGWENGVEPMLRTQRYFQMLLVMTAQYNEN